MKHSEHVAKVLTPNFKMSTCLKTEIEKQLVQIEVAKASKKLTNVVQTIF